MRAPILTLLAGLAAASLAAAPASAAPARRAAAARPAVHAAAAPATPAAAGLPVATLANEARAAEDVGDYAKAVATLRLLRGRTALDGDLELAIALDAVRGGQPDSAWALLHGRILSAALADSTHRERWHPVGPGRERTWLDGRFDGWYWTVARARAELALRLRMWDEAVLAARAAVRARPLSGRDHLLLAIAAGKAGDGETARTKAARAAELDPLTPEAFYLRGLWAWRDGHRAAARADFHEAITLDGTYRPAALARVRVELPAARPDTLPTTFLTGARRAAMLIASEGPKVEETLTSDQLPGIYGGVPSLAVPDSLRDRLPLDKPLSVEPTVLVGEAGQPVAIELPYMSPDRMPSAIVTQIGMLARTWRFKPAMRLGHPVPMWINVEITLHP